MKNSHLFFRGGFWAQTEEEVRRLEATGGVAEVVVVGGGYAGVELATLGSMFEYEILFFICYILEELRRRGAGHFRVCS